ncbi:MAG TPA: Abi family protein [Candidatus Limiplasma sp.]|nr:Abi family protein [Candidatus Limiplasma sp.]
MQQEFQQKPMLSAEEMIDHLIKKGVRFDKCSKEKALEILKNSNNYFKLTAYRKNYSKHPGGAQQGQYIDLDFAYLLELSRMDMLLRYALILMCLDVEHYLKVGLLSFIEANYKSEAYSIVQEYIASLNEADRIQLNASIDPKINSDVYRRSLIEKHRCGYPVWAFVEIIPFSDLIRFYTYIQKKHACLCCGNKGTPKCEKDTCKILRMHSRMNRMLNSVRSIRNAAAHNSCILNDLSCSKINGAQIAQLEFRQHIYKIAPNNGAEIRLSCVRVQQLLTLVYVHDRFVTSDSVRTKQLDRLKDIVCHRFTTHRDFFNSNTMVSATLDFMKFVLDNWQRV